MTRNLKAFCVTLLTGAAFTVGAPAAVMADVGQLHAEIPSSPISADVTAEQSQVQQTFQLTASGAQTLCAEAKFEGTVQGQPGSEQVTASELTLTPKYTECQVTAPVSSAATVDMNGCKYTITGGEAELTAKVDIAGCTTGKQIQITTNAGCTIDVPEQGPLSHITVTNEEGGGIKDIKAHITIQGITYQPTGAFCILGQAKHTDGDYEGTATVKGFVDTGETLQTTHNGH